ncbi:MBG domain-containing protein [Dokdonella sp.]|uniref:MBG domain-containing protein n=1 Tax=Dokdonella sp. TaxID=2291710 RepID=UPI0035286323
MDAAVRLFRPLRLRLATIVLATLAFATTAQADVVSDNAANWLISQQITTGPTAGAFPWTPGQAATSNTQGASALGLLRAWERSGNPAFLAAAAANGACQINDCVPGMTYGDGQHRFATHDPLFLEQLSIDSGDPQYADFADTEFWARLTAGIYGASANLDAAGYANAVLGSRTSQNIPELAAWDLSKAAIAAQLAGETVARDAFMQAILGSLNASDAAHSTYDVVGLTGAIWASAVTGIDLDPTSGKWAAANSTAQLANLMLAWQAPGGGFVGSTAAAGGAIDTNADSQTTAFAMQALDALNASAYASEITSGFAFITSLQEPSGEFLGYIGAAPGSQGAVESHGETLEAYASITQRPNVVYVDDDFLGDIPGQPESFTHPQVNGGIAVPATYGVDAFASISAALAEVQVGGTIYVAKGLYPESDGNGGNLVITRSVSVIGEQAGVDARTRSSADADETIVVPAVAQAGLGYGSYETSVVDMSGGGIVLDGLVIDGDNPGLNSGVAFNGADPDVAGGIYAQGNDNDLQNLVIRNIVYAGIDGYAIGAAVGGNIIRHNRFVNITRPSVWGRGIILQENFYAQVTENLFGEVRVGVQTNNNHRAAPLGFAPSISGNEIHAARTGIFHNLFYQNATTYTIADNQFIAVDNVAETGEWSGLWIESMGGAQTTVVSNNVIDGSAVVASRASVGYLLNNITSTVSSSSLIDGGTVVGVGAGVQATDATFYTGPVNDMIVRNVAFSDITVGAFYVEDTTQQAGSAKLTIGAGNSYTNVTHVLALAGAAPVVAFTDGITGVDNVFVRSANGYYNDPGSMSYTVANAAINSGIGYALVGGSVDVEAGSFSQNVIINKGIALRGPFLGVPGHDVGRTGAGEAVITPPIGRAVRINADNVRLDGFTIADVNDSAIVSGGNYGGGSTDVEVVNNRVLDVHSGSALYTNGDIVTGRVTNWRVSDNLFRNIDSAIGSGINLWKATGGTIDGNRIENSGFGGIQLNNSRDIDITDNRIINTVANGINVAISQSVKVIGNQISDANTSNDANAAGLTLYGGSSNVVMMCNAVDGSGNNGFSTSTGIPDPFSGIRVFDNALAVNSNISHNLAQGIDIGSNWYGGSAATISGLNAMGAHVADPLPATPIGTDVCNTPDPDTANNPTAIVAYAGSGQSTLVNTAFANPLQARVVDTLGGAVMGETVDFSAPISGATAVLGTLSGTTDFNGVLASTATANNLAGSYMVSAASGVLSPNAGFSLTNDPIIGTVTWDELSFVYDGNTHVATAFITEEPGTACVVTPVFGPNVGDYAVSATCNGTTYAASGTNTASITPADATLALSNLVQVFDGTPKSATVSSTPSGVAYSVTYNGSATAPSAVGVYAVVATITDGNYTGPQASGVLQIIEADAPDLAVTITDNRSFVQYGKLLTYTIVVNNPGNTDISGASVVSNLPITLLNASPSWECVQVSPGASCTPSGTGNLNDAALGIPAGGGVVYLFNAWVDDNASLPTDLIETEVTVTAASDSNPGNDSATDLTQIVIFRDGFDPGGDGAEDGDSLVNPDTASTLAGDTVKTLALAGAWTSEGRIVELARIGNGEARYEVQALRTSQQLLVRLLGPDRVSAWTAVAEGTAQLAIGLAEGQLLLVGGRDDLQLALASTSGLTIHLPRAD